MRKIWRLNPDGMAFAWIGKSAPVPEGWHTNEQNAKDAVRLKKPESTEPESPRKRGRRKG